MFCVYLLKVKEKSLSTFPFKEWVSPLPSNHLNYGNKLLTLIIYMIATSSNILFTKPYWLLSNELTHANI